MAEPMHADAAEVTVRVSGDVAVSDREYATEKVGRARELVRGPTLSMRVDLVAHTDPARERPAFAKAEVDLDGRIVRAHAAAATMHEAVDLLDARLRHRLERIAHHEESKHERLRGGGEHEWRHGDPSTPRPPYFPRPAEEREVIRTKTFAVDAMTPAAAVDDLEQLDHDFYLFHNRETGEDNVVLRADAGGYELLEPAATCSLADTPVPIRRSTVRPPTIPLQEAVDLLELAGAPFVFFLDPADGRGRVVYHRYDGHYGLITAASP